jgi:3-phenylpropionate/trans-cinnamate dioxygenase ferredoxin reductase subunit
VRTIVVVGTGVAGTTAAATLRAEGYDGRLVLVGAEPEAPYRRPALSKEVLRGDRTTAEIRIRPDAWYAQHEVELLTGTTVTDLDVAGRTVTADGAALGWDALVLATGGRARTLPGVDGVHVLRSAADAATLRSSLWPGAEVVVVGAGFLGAEVAATARGLGCEVTLLEAAPTPLGRLLPPAVADVYAELHRSRGVDLRTGVGIAGVEPGRVVATDGSEYRADAVVVAVGMDAEADLASRAGLPVEGGIVVDALGATPAPGVWAAGDAAAYPDPVTGLLRRREHWQSAVTQGTSVARNILGAAAPWTEVAWCWSDQYGVNLQVCGEPAPTDRMAVRGALDSGSFTAVFARDGVLSGAIAVDRPADIRAMRRLLASAPQTALEIVADEGTDLARLGVAPVAAG